MCVTVVQWSRRLLARADKPGSTPGERRCFLFLNSTVFFSFFFFPVRSLFLNTNFPLDRFFFILTADPAGHALGSIYFKLKSGVLFWQRDFKSS